MEQIILFVFSLITGILIPIVGVELIVPLLTAFLPFHIDFARGVGVTVALASALSSTMILAKRGLANIKVAVLIVFIYMLAGVLSGALWLRLISAFPEGKYYMSLTMSLISLPISLIVFLTMIRFEWVEFPSARADRFSKALSGRWYERFKVIEYEVTGTVPALVAFFITRFIGIDFTIPILNLIMRAPIKVAVSTNAVVILLRNAPAVWGYISKLSLLAVPSIVGAFIGGLIGAKLIIAKSPKFIRYAVAISMFFSAIGSMLNIYKALSGLGIV